MNVQEMKSQHAAAMSKADLILTAVERQKRSFTTHEQRTFDAHMKEADVLKSKIEASTPNKSKDLSELRRAIGLPQRQSHASTTDGKGELILPETLSREYHEAFYNKLAGRGPVSAALYEAVSTSGGNAVPIIVNNKAVPFSPQDSAIRRLATEISTRADLRNPQVLTRAVATAKAETSSFTQAQQSLGSFTLSAYSIGLEVTASLELFEDVDLFSAFLLEDAGSAFLELEEGYFLAGTGNGQPQGILGNVGGITAEPDTAGNLVSVDAIWDLVASLKDTYYPTAHFVLSRSTALAIRRSQVGSGSYYEPIFRRENGVNLLADFPIEYSSQMPTAARSATPVLFGAFDRGYVIGDRGGPALLVKVIDQAASALSGMRDLLFFRRVDGRVKDAQAIVGLTIASS